jgi:alkanesulfonate monooxygenase SsuD/methylene tetrahydromethanopterin reductase-like flavin-dependent oxidoreductase (luciferase family)
VLADLAVLAEDSGWDGFFLWDHVAFGPDPVDMTDAWITLAAVAARTTRIRFGPMVTPLPRRRPWKVARETVALDQLSAGRLILGVGIGEGAAEYENLGDEGNRKVRGAMLDEGLDLLTALWSGDLVNHDGAHYHVREARFVPRPVQQPRIPIWVAGVWPNKPPMRRAARWDGVFPLQDGVGWDAQMSADAIREVVAYVRAQRADDTPFDVAHWGITTGTDAVADRATVATYAEAGVTWWLENILPARFGGWEPWPLDAMRARIAAGPPR